MKTKTYYQNSNQIFPTKGIKSKNKSSSKSIEEELRLKKINQAVDLLKFENFCRKEKAIKTIKVKPTDYIFGFNLGDSLRFSENAKLFKPLLKYNSFISYGKTQKLKFRLKKNKKYEIIFLKVDGTVLKEIITNCESTNLQDFIKISALSYTASLNLKVMDRIQKLKETKKESLSEMEIIGHIYILVSLIIKQYLREQKQSEIKTSCLRNWEMSELKKISKEIRENPEKPYTVSGISKKTGVSIPRLQEGFKEMHGMTIAIFIREMRLQKAEQLIRKSNYNISEIVYSIGLTSRSYFSRIFKEKYNCSPSNYQEKHAS